MCKYEYKILRENIMPLNGINFAYIHFFKDRIETPKKSAEKQNFERKSKETSFPLTSYPANYYINSPLSSGSNEKLPGYEREKLKIEKLLIDLINKNKVGIPSGVILAEDEPTTGKAFVDYIKTQTNANVVSLNTSPENFIKDTLTTLNEAKEKKLPDIDEEKIQRLLEYPDNTYVQVLNKSSENSDLKYKTNMQTVETATQAKLRNENKIMQIAKIACKDILENDKTISAVEKEILINQQKNKLFLKLVSNNFKDDKLSKIENNVLNTIAELAEDVSDLTFEKEGYRKVFSDCEYSDDSKSNYILNLLYSAQTDNTFNKAAEIKDVTETFYNAKKSGCTASAENSWEKMVYIASEYFEFHLRSVLTNRNVELLNSINDNLLPDDSPQLHKLAFDKNLTIEEREFIVRYKDDKNFQKLLNNPDVKIKDIIEELLLFELLNKENDFDDEKNNLKEMMSRKFKQIIKDENSEKGLLNEFLQANKKFAETMKDLIRELDDFKRK